jgi:hypothetical protein
MESRTILLDRRRLPAHARMPVNAPAVTDIGDE